MEKWRFIPEDKIENRPYQDEDVHDIVGSFKRGKNVGLVYPTSLGKTYTAFKVMDHYLDKGKILFLAPTNALCEQHLQLARSIFTIPEEESNRLTGQVPKKKRESLWSKSRIIVSTPQTIMSEIGSAWLDWSEVVLIVFDEMHMSVKNYDYVKIGAIGRDKKINMLGMTASSGREWRLNLLEKHYDIKWWIYRSSKEMSDNPATRQYIFPQNELRLELDPTVEYLACLQDLVVVMKTLHNDLSEIDVTHKIHEKINIEAPLPFLSLTQLKTVHDTIAVLVEKKKGDGEKDAFWFLLVYAAYFRLVHLLHVFSTEGYEVALAYIERIVREEFYKPAVQTFWNDYYFQSFRRKLVELVKRNVLHPKLERTKLLVDNYVGFGTKMLIFSNYEESAQVIVNELVKSGNKARLIAGTKFMKVREQRELLASFGQDEFEILVATSVIEAGIHVPKIDILINYSMPLTGIARIQRNGRVGRTFVGKIFHLIMKNTADADLYFAGKADNKKMDEELRRRLNVQNRIKQGVQIELKKEEQLLLGEQYSHEQMHLKLKGKSNKGKKKPDLDAPWQMNLFDKI